MKFMLLLFDPEGYWESVTEEQMGAALDEHAAFARYLRDRGIAFSGEALKPGTEARSLRPAGDGVVSADEPFVRLRQDLAGFYIIECADLDEAEAIAARRSPLAARCPLGAGRGGRDPSPLGSSEHVDRLAVAGLLAD